MPLNIIVVGVGGQGILSMSHLIGEAALRNGVKAIVAETHGLSQRGGSVIVHVRIGNDAMSPLSPPGLVHVMLALEMTEAARYAHYLMKNGIAIVNDKFIRPTLPNVKNPARSDVIRYISEITPRMFVVDASSKAMELGNPLGANMVILGFITYLLEELNLIDFNTLKELVSKIGGKKYGPINIELINYGRDLAKEKISKDIIDWISAEISGK